MASFTKVPVQKTLGTAAADRSSSLSGTFTNLATGETIRPRAVTARPKAAKPSITAEEKAARTLEAGARRGVSAHNTGGTPTMAQLSQRARQAMVDMDMETLNHVNAQMKERRAASGRQTVGDRVNDTLSSMVSGSAGSLVNIPGTLVDTLGAINTRNRNYTTAGAVRAAQDNIARYRQQLETAGTAEERERLERLIRSNENRMRLMGEQTDSQEARTHETAGKIYQAADRLSGDSAKFRESAKQGLGTFGSALVDAGISFGQSMADAGISALTGTGMAPFVLRSFGGGTQEARQGGASLDQQLLYGTAQAAKEYITEKLFGLAVPQKLAGSGSFGSVDEGIEKGIRYVTEKLAKTPAGQKVLGGILTWGAGGVTEGLEEGIGDVIENLFINPYLRGWDPDTRTGREKLDDAINDMLVGGLSGLMGVTNLGSYRAGRTAPGTAQKAAPAGVEGAADGAAAKTRSAVQTDPMMEDARRTGAQTAAPGQRKAAPGTGTADMSLLERVRQSIPQTQNMAPVAELTGTEIPAGGKMVDRLVQFISTIGGKVNRPGFGDVLFSRGRIKSSMLGHGAGPAKIETFAAVPEVIRYGMQVDFQPNWKGRGYDTYTFTAPVNYKGSRNYLGVIVTKDAQSSRYYVHEVVDADGNILFRNDETPASASDGTSALSGDLDTVANAGTLGASPSDGRASPEGTVDTVGTSSVEGTRPLNSDSTIAQDADAVKYRGGDVDDGLGAADAGSLNSDYDRLQAQSTRFHPEGENPARPVDVPKVDFEGRAVSQTASTVMGAQAIPDDVIPMIEQMAADGKLSYDPVTNAAAEARARARIEQNGFDGAMEEYRSAVRAGKTSPDIEILGQTLLNNAANARDGKAIAELLSLYQAGGTNTAQAMQARRVMRKLSPEGQLYAIQRAVDNINNGEPAGRGVEVSEQEAADAAGAVREALDETLAQLEAMTGAYQSGETEKPRSERWVDRLGADLARNAERRAKPSKEKQSTVYETVLRDLSAAMADHVRKGPVRKGRERTVYDTITDMLTNRQEYAAAWQTAQNTLLEKYSNDPAMMEAFKEFNETSPLYGGIGPDSAMMKAVAQAALDQDLTVKDLVIRGTYDADALTNQIFDELVRRVSPQSGTDRAVLREAVQRYVQRKTERTGKYAIEYINSDISRVMRKIGVKISDVIRSSPGSKTTTANLISDILVQQYGVSADAAKSIAADIAADFQKTVQEASRRKLEQIFKDRPARQQKGFQKKFEELANLGAFSGEFNEAAVQKVFELDQGGSVKISQELIQKFLDQADQAGRDAVMEEIVKDVAGQLPGSWGKIFDSMRYLAMLGNTRTHVRNIIGNFIFQPLTWGKNRLGGIGEAAAQRAGLDVDRTKTAAGANPFGKLAREARAEYRDIDIFLGAGKYSENRTGTDAIRDAYSPYKNVKHLQKLADALEMTLGRLGRWNGKALEKEDALFKAFIYGQTLADYLKANGIHSIQDAPRDLLSRARNYAAQEALRNTFNDSNMVSDAAASLGRARNSENKVVKAAGYAAEGILPFKRTPANVLVRSVEYSPAGAAVNTALGVRDLLTKGRNGELTGAEVSRRIDRIAAGMSGSALAYLGYLLAKAGFVTGGEDEDKDQQAFLDLQGHQNYAFETDEGRSYTLDWAAPSAIPFFMGVELFRSAMDGKLSADELKRALGNLSSPLLEMSMLQGLNDAFADAAYAVQRGDNPMSLILENALSSYFTQVIPTLGGQIERTGEDRRMSTYTEEDSGIPKDLQYFLGKISQKVPGWDYQQIPYIDAWGREEMTGSVRDRALENFLSPGYASQISTGGLERELQRIKDATGDSGVFPARAERKFKVNGVEWNMGAEEYVRYARILGETRHQLLGELMGREGYRALSDQDKAKVIGEVYHYAQDAARREIAPEYQPDRKTLEMLNSPLPKADYFLYKTMLAAEKKKGTDREANEAVRQNLMGNDTLSAEEKHGLDELLLNDNFIIQKDVQVDYSNRDTFQVSQMSDGAQKHWELAQRAVDGITPEQYAAAWEIFTRSGTKKRPYTKDMKVRDLVEELGLSRLEVNKLLTALNKEVE